MRIWSSKNYSPKNRLALSVCIVRSNRRRLETITRSHFASLMSKMKHGVWPRYAMRIEAKGLIPLHTFLVMLKERVDLSAFSTKLTASTNKVADTIAISSCYYDPRCLHLRSLPLINEMLTVLSTQYSLSLLMHL